MKSLDRAIQRDRNKRYRTIKKLFKARDAASKYTKNKMPISFLLRMIGEQSVRHMTTTAVAKTIVDYGDMWLIKPKPPRNVKPSILKTPNPPPAPEPTIGRRK